MEAEAPEAGADRRAGQQTGEDRIVASPLVNRFDMLLVDIVMFAVNQKNKGRCKNIDDQTGLFLTVEVSDCNTVTRRKRGWQVAKRT